MTFTTSLTNRKLSEYCCDDSADEKKIRAPHTYFPPRPLSLDNTLPKMNIFFKRNPAFYREKANNQATRCVSVDATLTETKTHKQPTRFPLCVGMREKTEKEIKKGIFFSFSWLYSSQSYSLGSS
ncbi:hypothetical protein AVEN_162079-1 [Araneus ventricosus]|uniref:Uncharacterized protein n=1 Tax=Araneus ventricosus TaxID=182803 RepID=A0A4Y2H8Y3_ARAVE|nr:hypothetical protein AVEN_162079-1 [Araneus ventricosus]